MAFDESKLVFDRGEQAVKDVVVAIQNGQRAGTASTSSKGEVAGSNKKPWKQKGTGRARVGLRQNPVWRGGGIAFGPKPRDFSQKVNRKVSQLAFTRAEREDRWRQRDRPREVRGLLSRRQSRSLRC